jgi:hypothetical protein
VSDLSLKRTLELQRELVTTGISSARTWGEVQGLMNEFMGMTPGERARHPEALFLTALTIWAARVGSGEDLTLLDACDVPLSAVQWVAEPADNLPAAVGKAPARAKAAGGKPRKSTT